MEKNQRDEQTESLKKVGVLWADLHAESQEINTLTFADDEEKTASFMDRNFFSIELDQKQSTCSGFQKKSEEKNALDYSLDWNNNEDFRDKSSNTKIFSFLFLGISVMIFFALGLWSLIWMQSQQKVFNKTQPATQIQIADQSLLDYSPALLTVANVKADIPLKTDFKRLLTKANRYLLLGKQALKERHVSVAIYNFALAKQYLNQMPEEQMSALRRELYVLYANALYWQGFLALQREDLCLAKTLFFEGEALSPHDKKIKDRLNELPASLKC